MSYNNQHMLKWLQRWRNACPELDSDIEAYTKLVAAFREAEVTFICCRHEVLCMESLILKKDMEGRYLRVLNTSHSDNEVRASREDVADEAEE